MHQRPQQTSPRRATKRARQIAIADWSYRLTNGMRSQWAIWNAAVDTELKHVASLRNQVKAITGFADKPVISPYRIADGTLVRFHGDRLPALKCDYRLRLLHVRKLISIRNRARR